MKEKFKSNRAIFGSRGDTQSGLGTAPTRPAGGAHALLGGVQGQLGAVSDVRASYSGEAAHARGSLRRVGTPRPFPGGAGPTEAHLQSLRRQRKGELGSSAGRSVARGAEAREVCGWLRG